MLASILLATLILFGASLHYNDQLLAVFTALMLYVATLVTFYVRRPD